MARQFTRHKAIKDRENAILSSDPEQAINEIMASIDVLRGIYRDETEALSTSNAQGFLEMQDEKSKATRRYQKSISEILVRREEIKAADPALKDRLTALYAEFTQELEGNQQALSRVKTTTQRLKNSIGKATREAAQKKTALRYGKSGALHSDPRRILSTGLIETV